MKIEKSQIIKDLMNIQKNPHTNNIVNCKIDVIINKLIQTDSIECVFSKESYLRSNLENKTVKYFNYSNHSHQSRFRQNRHIFSR